MASWTRRIGIALVLTAIGLPLGGVQPVRAAAATQYIFNLADDSGLITDCTSIFAGCTLRDAIHAAASGDIVTLAPGIHTAVTTTLTHGEIVINKGVTIQGRGLLTVDGNGTDRVFESYGPRVEMDGVTIANGQVTDASGAGIYQSGGVLTLVDCVVTSNVVSGTGKEEGGGIYIDAASVTLTNTTVSGNTVESAGTASGSSALGGSIATNYGQFTITNSTISGNTARMTAGTPSQDVEGGGIYVGDIYNLSQLTISGSTVSGNRTLSSGTVNNRGGGISVAASATITNSTIASNVAASQGGGLPSPPGEH